jgi:hypothetical protein
MKGEQALPHQLVFLSWKHMRFAEWQIKAFMVDKGKGQHGRP